MGKIKIVPLKGYITKEGEEINYGMTQDEVNRSLGEPYTILIDNIVKNISETYRAYKCVYKDGKLRNATFTKYVPLFVNDIDIFNDELVIEKLKAIDSNFEVAKNLRHIVFYSLGLCMGGFLGKKIPEGKLVIAFGINHIDYYRSYINV